MKNTIRTKITAAVLAAIITCSVGTMAMSVTAHAAEKPTFATGLNITEKMKITLDKDLLTAQKMSTATILKIIEGFTKNGKYVCPALGILADALIQGQGDKTQEKLDEINDKIDRLFEAIKDSEKSIKSTFENIAGLQSFYESFVDFKSKTEILYNNIKIAKENPNLSNTEKLAEIASLIGNSKDWEKSYEHSLTSLRNFMNKVSYPSGENVFVATYNYFTGKTMFSGEALDKAKVACEGIMQTYTAGSSVILECLCAQLYVNCLTDETKATISKEYMNDICKDTYKLSIKINDVLEPMIGRISDIKDDGTPVIDTSGTFKAKMDAMLTSSRTILVNEGHSSLKLSAFLFAKNHEYVPTIDKGLELECASGREMAEWFNKNVVNGQINGDIVRSIAAYAGKNGKTIRQLLNENGFDTSNLPTGAYLISSEAYVDSDAYPRIEYCWDFYKGFNIDAAAPSETVVQFRDIGRNGWKLQHWNFANPGTACRFQAV